MRDYCDQQACLARSAVCMGLQLTLKLLSMITLQQVAAARRCLASAVCCFTRGLEALLEVARGS